MKIEWGSSKTVDGREVLEGTTVVNGKSYKVKVSYNASTYGKKADINKQIDDIFHKIKESDFERLEGYTVKTSLQKVEGKRSFSVLKGANTVNLDELKTNNNALYKSIKKVNKAFLDFKPKKEVEEEEVEEDIEIEVAKEEPAKKQDLQSLKDLLSGRNPAKKDEELLGNILQFNKAPTDKLKGEILEAIRTIKSDEFKHEVVRLMQDKKIQQEFRIALGFIKEGDIVCEFAQSSVSKIDRRRKDAQGQFACGPICLKAIRRLLQGGRIKSEKDIHAIIKEGVTFHVAKMNTKVQDLEGLLKEFNKGVPKKEKLKESEDLLDEAFGKIDQILPHLTEEKFKGHYCLLTFPVGEKQFGKTVFAYYSDNKFYLFDSHSTTINGVTGFGATLRGFDKAEDLAKHLQDNYIKKQDNFEYHFIGRELKK